MLAFEMLEILMNRLTNVKLRFGLERFGPQHSDINTNNANDWSERQRQYFAPTKACLALSNEKSDAIDQVHMWGSIGVRAPCPKSVRMGSDMHEWAVLAEAQLLYQSIQSMNDSLIMKSRDPRVCQQPTENQGPDLANLDGSNFSFRPRNKSRWRFSVQE